MLRQLTRKNLSVSIDLTGHLYTTLIQPIWDYSGPIITAGALATQCKSFTNIQPQALKMLTGLLQNTPGEAHEEELQTTPLKLWQQRRAAQFVEHAIRLP
jgi:hypothetical protein